MQKTGCNRLQPVSYRSSKFLNFEATATKTGRNRLQKNRSVRLHIGSVRLGPGLFSGCVTGPSNTITKARVVPANDPEDEDNTTERREARKRENKRKELRVVRESMEIIL